MCTPANDPVRLWTQARHSPYRAKEREKRPALGEHEPPLTVTKERATSESRQDQDLLLPYRLRAVRIGVIATAFALGVLALFPALPGSGSFALRPYVVLIVIATVGVALVALLPWDRLLRSRFGLPMLYAWSIFDIGLVSWAIGITGGARSSIFLLYTLTTIFFALAYPPRAHAALLGLTYIAYTGTLALTGWDISPAALLMRLATLGILAFIGSLLASELFKIVARSQEVARRMEELDELKSDFISTISHELRTPVTIIMGSAEVLTRRWAQLPEAMRLDLIARLSRRAGDLNRLLEEILDFARAERGVLEIQLRPVDVRREVQRTLAKLEMLLAGRPFQMIVPAGLFALADTQAFGHVLENLLSNAVKFSAPNARLAVRAGLEGEEVVISVEDAGVGIPPEDRDRIFERFYRVERGDTASAGGTGIGLAIVKAYVEAQGGRVWVESELGRGSTFSFALRSARNHRQVRIPEARGPSREARSG